MNRRTRASSQLQRGKKSFKAVSNSFIQKKAKVTKTAKKKFVKTAKAEVKNTSQKLKDIKEGEPNISSTKLQEPENEETEARNSREDCEHKTLSVLEIDKSKGNRKDKGELTNQSPISVRLTEHDAGITEYISNHSGFSGIIKQRYSDFHVNEIDSEGNVVTLTTTNVPVEKSQRVEDSLEYLKNSLPGELFKKLVLLFDSKVDEVEIEATDLSKDARRKLHMAVLNCGKSTLMSNTVEKGNKKYITVKKKNIGKPDRRSSDWPSGRGGDYVHFALHKENMDTMETVNIIAGRLRIRPSMISYAGTKDRRAKTTQLMSVRKIEPSRLAAISRGLKGIELGNYRFQKYPLELGDLKGNRFRIVLRNVKGTDQQIEQAITSMKTKGFINYYGLQRFGTSLTVPTYEIGKALLQGKWEKAVELILKPRGEDETCRFLSEARKLWWETRDASLAFKVLRNKNKSLEGKLLFGLSRSGPANYLSALDNIPRNTRLMYLHSYQSLLWNKVVSRRIKEFGLKPLVGDLVLQGNEIIPSEPDDFADTVEQDSSTKVSGDQTVDGSNKHRPKVSVLTEANLSSAGIFDVVLPLPGHDIEYPKNEIGMWFEELLHKDGLSSAKLKQTVKTYSLGGTYRKLVVCPTNMNWKIMHYSDPQTTLVLSDLEEMQKVDPPKDVRDGIYKALLLDFCLPSSTYATMAIREILKIDTSCYNQSLLNDYHLSGNSTSSTAISSSMDNCETAQEDKSCQMEVADIRSTRSRLSVYSGTKNRQEPNSTVETEGEPDKKKPKILREKSGRFQSNRNGVKDSQPEVMKTRRASAESKKKESNILTDTDQIVDSKLGSLRSTSRRSKVETNPCQSIVLEKRIKSANVSGQTRKEKITVKSKKLNASDKTKSAEVKSNERRPVRNTSLKNNAGGTKRKMNKVGQVEVKSELKMGLRRRSVPASEPDIKRIKKLAKITPVSEGQMCKPESEKRISRRAKTKIDNLTKTSNLKAYQGEKLSTEADNVNSHIKIERLGKATKETIVCSSTTKSEPECVVGTQTPEKQVTVGNIASTSKTSSKLETEFDTVKLENESEMGNTVCSSITPEVELEVVKIKSNSETEALDKEYSKAILLSSSTTKSELDCVVDTEMLGKEDAVGTTVSTSKSSSNLDLEIDTVKLEKESEMRNTVCSAITSELQHGVDAVKLEVDKIKSNIKTVKVEIEDCKANIVCRSTTKSEPEYVVGTQTLEKQITVGNIVSTSKPSSKLETEIDTVKVEKESEMGKTVCSSITSEVEHVVDAVKADKEECTVNAVCNTTRIGEYVAVVGRENVQDTSDGCLKIETSSIYIKPDSISETQEMERIKDEGNINVDSIFSGNKTSEKCIVDNINVNIPDTNMCKNIVCYKDINESPTALTASEKIDGESKNCIIADISEEYNDSVQMPSKHTVNSLCDESGHNVFDSSNYLISSPLSKQISRDEGVVSKKSFNNSECEHNEDICVEHIVKKTCDSSPVEVNMPKNMSDNTSDSSITEPTNVSSDCNSTKYSTVDSVCGSSNSMTYSVNKQSHFSDEKAGCIEKKEIKNLTTDISKNVIDEKSLDIEIKLSSESKGSPESINISNVGTSKNCDNSNNSKAKESELDCNNLKSKGNFAACLEHENDQSIINNTNLNKLDNIIPETSKGLEISTTHEVCQLGVKEDLETVKSGANRAANPETSDVIADVMQKDIITYNAESNSSHSEEKVKTADIESSQISTFYNYPTETVATDVQEELAIPIKSVGQLNEEITERSGDVMLEEKCFNEQIKKNCSNSLLTLTNESDIRKVAGSVTESAEVSCISYKNDVESDNKIISQISDSEHTTNSMTMEQGCCDDKAVLKYDLNSQTHVMEIDPPVEDGCNLNPKKRNLKNEFANICIEDTILELSESTKNVSDKIDAHEINNVRLAICPQILASEAVDRKNQIEGIDKLVKCDIAVENKEIYDLCGHTKCSGVTENMDGKLKENFSEPINEVSEVYHQSKPDFKEVTKTNSDNEDDVEEEKNKYVVNGVKSSIPNKTCAISSVMENDDSNLLKSKNSSDLGKSFEPLPSEQDIENSNIKLPPHDINETSEECISNVCNTAVAELCDINCTAGESLGADCNKMPLFDMCCDDGKNGDLVCSKLVTDSESVESDINCSPSLVDIGKIGTAACESKLESDLKSNNLISSCALAENENLSDFRCENSVSSIDVNVQLDAREIASCPTDFKENISVVMEDCSEKIQHNQERKDVMDMSGERIPEISKEESEKSVISEMGRKENELFEITDRCVLLHKKSSIISAGKIGEASIMESLKQEDETAEVKSQYSCSTKISPLPNEKGCISKMIMNEQKLADKSDEMNNEELDNGKDDTTTTSYAFIAAKTDGSDSDIFEQLCPSIREKYESSVESGLPELKGEGKGDLCLDNKKTNTESKEEFTEELLKSNTDIKLHSSDLVEDSTQSRVGTVESSESTAMENKIKHDDSNPVLPINSVENVIKSVLNLDMLNVSKTQEVANICCDSTMPELQNSSKLSEKQNCPQKVHVQENTINMPIYNSVETLKSEGNMSVQQDKKHDFSCDSSFLMDSNSTSVETNNSSSGMEIRPGTKLTDLCNLNDVTKVEEGEPSSSMKNDNEIEIDTSTSVNNEFVKPFSPVSEAVLNDPNSQSSEFADVKSLECNSGESNDIIKKENVSSGTETNLCIRNLSEIEMSCSSKSTKAEHLHSCTLNEDIRVKSDLKTCSNDTFSSLTYSSTNLTYGLNIKSVIECAETNTTNSGQAENLIDVTSCKDEILSDELSVKMLETGIECDTKLSNRCISDDNTSQLESDICSQTQSKCCNVDYEKASRCTNKLLPNYEIVAENETVDTKDTVLCSPQGKELASNLQSCELHKIVSSTSKNVELKPDIYKYGSDNSVEQTECINSGEVLTQKKDILVEMTSVKNIDRTIPIQKSMVINPNKNESVNCLILEKTPSNLENRPCSETIISSSLDEINKSSSHKNNYFPLSEESSTLIVSTKKSKISEIVTEPEAALGIPPSNQQNEAEVISTDSEKSAEELKAKELQITRPLISLEQIPSVKLSNDSKSECVTSLEINKLGEIERIQDCVIGSEQKLTNSAGHSNLAVKRKNETDSESDVKKVKVTEVSVDSDSLKTSVQTKRKVDISDVCGSMEDNGVEMKKLKESYE